MIMILLMKYVSFLLPRVRDCKVCFVCLLRCHDLLFGMHIIIAYTTEKVVLFVEASINMLLLKTVNIFEEVFGCY